MDGSRGLIDEIVGVYDADGSLRGELAYLVGKLAGRRHCELCDITHGRLRPRPEVDAWRAALPVPLTLLHLDERPADLVTATQGRAPCVLARSAGRPIVLLGRDQLAACGGDVDALARAVDAAVDAAGLRWPDARPG